MTRRFTFTRRTAIKGGVVASAALSAPLLPGRSTAYAYDVATEAVPLRGPSRRDGRVPATGVHGHSHDAGAASTEADTHLAFGAIDTEPFYMVALSWMGGPGVASIRAATNGAWTDWVELHGSTAESPDEGGVAPDRCWTQPAWVGDDHTRVEVAVPAGADDVLVHLISKTERRVTRLEQSAAGSAPLVIPRSSWTSAGPAYEPYVVASRLQLAVIHHSVGANGYGPDEVPGILEGIRRFHVEANGWNDIAYNFAIDRFGRIWEARGGGIDKAVVGGHALGWNTGTMGVVFLGDYTRGGLDHAGRDIASLVALLKWKFNRVHNVDPSGSTTYTVGASGTGSRFAAGQAVGCRTVVAHRDVSQTACPGNPVFGALEGVWSELVRLSDVRGIAASPRNGYYLVTGYGAVHTRRGAPFTGSMNGEPLNAPALTLAPTPSGNGYWILAADGGIFSFGDARFFGSTGGIRLNQPVVGMASTRTGEGYWLVASDGGIFAFGDAQFFGSMGGVRLNQPVVGMAPTSSGNGYWMVAADGGVFAFGDAAFVGSGGNMQLSAPAVAVGPHPQGIGYWVALADGRVMPFGVADLGSAPANAGDPVVGITVTASGGGYLLVRRSGVVHAAGDATA
jgi:hypothetical protein